MLDYEHPKQYIINKVKVSGIKYLDPEVVASMSGLTKGDTIMIPSDYLSSTLKTMWNQRIYSDVQILTEPVGDSVNIEIVLRERPRVYDWKIEGVRKGQMSELLETLKLKKGSELSDFVLNSSKDAIRKYFAEKGFYNADVSVRLENDTTLENVVNVFFVVDRKNRVKIGKIDFEGNTALSDRQLRRSFKKTHQKSINIFKGAKYKEKDYEEDKENLIDFYNSRGYRNATILSDSVYRINDKRLGIALKVDEGNKFYYRNVSWTGNSVYETRQLNDMLGISKGETYDKKTLHKRLGIGKHADYEDMSSISSLYQNNGYLFSSIDPGEVVVGEDSIDINVKIFEGKQAKINEVKISGNHRVNDRVIRRELYVRPGELYNRALLMQTIRQLNQMQHFDPETSPGIDLVPNSNELVDISFPLEEVASDKFEISGGWGSNMFVGSVGVQLNNVSLKNFFKGSEWRPYPHGQNQQLAIRGQTNGSYYKAISLNFTEPWLGGKKPNSLTVGLYYSDETDAYYAWQSGNRHFRTIGVSVGIGRRLSWPDRYFTIYNEISYQAYNLKDWSSFLVTNGTSNIFALKTVLARNSVDSPIYPRTGSEFSLSLTLTPPYSLFQKNVDYADPNLPDYKRYKWIEYHKWQFKAQWYYPLTNNNKLVLMARAEMGYLGSYNKNKPSPFEGFDVGGDGMSGYNVYGVEIVGLRGYENSALTPYTYTADGRADYARAYNKYTMEIRYPFILKPSSTIYGLVFAEGGNAFKSWKEFDPFLIKRSIGVGARIYLPIVGMLGIDWGYGFDKAVGQTERSGSQVHFIIGTQF
ncbi:MAG: outer membrane protein assembly factor [Alistipes ihumii]